ncbi:MAG: CRTAC1 family protein, partial [Phycisphaeraceae bacterium]|nr:CRTAC1 family protein [Phycisphaeraceae bacterium]
GPRRAQLEAILELEWPEDLLAGPRLVRIKKLNVWDQTGTPAFGVSNEINPYKITKGNLKRLASVIVHDVTGDGLPELVLPRANLIYHNEGRFKFRGETLCYKPVPLQSPNLLADFDGDGLADLVGVDASSKKLVLFRGSGQVSFKAEPVVACEEVDFENPEGITAGDIDGDGDLDLFLGQYLKPYERGQLATPYYDANDGKPDYLLLNDGTGRFVDITEQAGLKAKRHRRTLRAMLVDFDGDHDLDLAVICDFAGMDLWENNGKGFFTDVTDAWIEEPKAFGMGASMADFNRDGRLDFYLVGMSSTTASRLMKMGLAREGFEMENTMRGPMTFGNRLYLADEKGRLTMAPWAPQTARAGWAWGVAAADFDNDADADIYVANGHLSGESAKDYCTRYWCHDIYLHTPEPTEAVDKLLSLEARTLRAGKTSWNGYEHNFLFVDNGQNRYQNLSYLAGVAFEFDSRAVVANDLDGDGRLDLLVSHNRYAQPAEWLLVCRNRLENAGHWLTVRLKASKGRPWPIGARVEARAGDRTFVHAVVTGDSFQAQHDMVAHFGLGAIDKVDWVQVRWPDGTVSRLEAPAIDRTHLVEAASGKKP